MTAAPGSDGPAKGASAANTLDAKARAAGIILERPKEEAAAVPDATKRALAEALGPAPPAPEPTDRAAYVPEWLDRTRAFGVALQLYQLRSSRNLGIGDLGDLRALIPAFAERGADFIGLNPMHALFTAAPERASPFSPSDRRFLNPFIVAVDAVPGYRPSMLSSVQVPSAHETVDYTAAGAAKLSVLRAIHAAWRAGDPAVPETARQSAARHASEGGEALRGFALFEALSHHMAREGRGAGWTSWPAQYHDRSSAAVRAFAQAHEAEIAFHAWLQYLADDQLRATQEAARAAGMRIGLYLDLAVGAAPDGASTWADPGLVMRGVRVGAPPDLFSVDGQDWGLAPLSPTELAARDFAPYRAVLSAIMRHAGAARVDHAMGLERLWLIPEGMKAPEGAYVRQAGLVEELVKATHAHRALAIGEDLGIVPPGFRERMARRRIFSMRILYFEKEGGRMVPPARYPKDALACLSTHDIAPLEAWWQGDEIDLRRRLGRIDADAAAHEHAERVRDRRALMALAGLPPRRGEGPLDDGIILALHRLVARTASRLAVVRLEDVVGGRRLVNLPGTDREHPNWRQTLPIDVDGIARSSQLDAVMKAMREERKIPP